MDALPSDLFHPPVLQPGDSAPRATQTLSCLLSPSNWVASGILNSQTRCLGNVLDVGGGFICVESEGAERD